MLDAGRAFELDQLLFGLLREADVFDSHDSPKVTRFNFRRAASVVKFKSVCAPDEGLEAVEIFLVNLDKRLTTSRPSNE
ncbi:MAG: hypothetical protein ACRD9R_04060 [Pyrinomonadaceae bacterium]